MIGIPLISLIQKCIRSDNILPWGLHYDTTEKQLPSKVTNVIYEPFIDGRRKNEKAGREQFWSMLLLYADGTVFKFETTEEKLQNAVRDFGKKVQKEKEKNWKRGLQE